MQGIDCAYPLDDTQCMNWQHLIQELIARGWTQKQLAARIGVVQSAISELGTGKTADPKFATGQALVLLHASGERYPAAESTKPGADKVAA